MYRILAVDDDEDILEVLQFILEDSGYDVETLSDGKDFLEKIQLNTPDLILLDIMLGNMDGRELCKVVKSSARTRAIPVILVSASHDLTGIEHEEGCPDAFLAKPFDIYELLETIRVKLSAA